MSTHIDATEARVSSDPSSTELRKRFDTELSASAGHSMYQSMVQQLISDGNWRHRERNASPTGDMHRMMCRLSRTRLMNVWYSESLPMGALMLSANPSATICVSVKRNTVGTPSMPVCWYRFLRSSRNSCDPYPRLSSMEKHLNPATNDAKRVRLCFPEPPTPTSIAFPRG